MNILVLILGLTISAQAFASPQGVLCQEEPSQSMGAFGFELSTEHLQPNSGYTRVFNAGWSYAYSGVNGMSCTNSVINMNRDETIRCVGYSNDQWLIEITVHLKNGVGTAQVHNIDKNVYSSATEGMILPCRLY
jgi:hypothetical protein